MASSDLHILGAFLIAAEERSFTKAARRLGVSPSAVSHAIRGLEESLGVRLLSRTTRNVAPTEAGQELLVRLRPAFTDIEDALDKLSGLRDKPVGRVRLVTPRLAAMMVIAPRMKSFAQDYPDIVLDVTTDESPMDIVAGGYDAGIHFGEYIQKDMIAVRVSGDQRAAIVGSAAYFKSNPMPKTPRALTSHRCTTTAAELAAKSIGGSLIKEKRNCPWR
jgi:DNA-binding transcriptional LysR family regulator